MAEHHRTVVVGGGVAGCSCLFHLAARGVSDCVLLEKRGLANGSTGHAPAFIETQYLRPDRVRMCAYGLELYERFEREDDLRFVHVGKLLLGGDQDLAGFAQSVAFQESIGFTGARVLGRSELAQLAPQLVVEGYAGALWGPRDGYVDPGQLARVYVAAAERRGARALVSTEVQSITVCTGGGFEIQTDRGRFACETLVNATGAWSGTFTRDLGIEIPVQGYRGQVARFDLDPPMAEPLPLIVESPNSPGASLLYFREDGSGSILAGIHTDSVSSREVEDPDAYARLADAGFQLSVSILVRERFSRTYALNPAGGWAGLYPLTPDGEPILGEVAALPGLFNAVGLGGNGIQLSGAVGRVIADLMIDGNTDLLPSLDDYRLERFDGERG
jgi:sarcosine oxidase subunit beta